MLKNKTRAIFRDAVRYGLYGVVVYLVGLVLMVCLVEILEMHYFIALIISFFFVTIFGHAIHRWLTFRSGNRYSREVFGYGIVVIGQFACTAGAMIILVEICEFRYWLANAISATVMSIVSFFVHRGYTFSKTPLPEIKNREP